MFDKEEDRLLKTQVLPFSAGLNSIFNQDAF